MTDSRSPARQEKTRIAAMMTVGFVVLVAVGVFSSWLHAPASGFGAAALTFCGLAWRQVLPLSAEDSQEYAFRETPGRWVRATMLASSTVLSVVAVALIFFEGRHLEGKLVVVPAMVGMAVIFANWLLIHTVYMLRYAQLHFDGSPSRINFNDDGYRPTYSDFAYVAFTVGITFAVSDVTLVGTAMRRLVLTHAAYSYLFGTGILVMAFNVVGTFLG